MTGRAILETVVASLITFVITVLGTAIYLVAFGGFRAELFTMALHFVLGTLWPVLAFWTALVLIGNLRNRFRASATKLRTGMMSTAATCVATAVGWSVLWGTGDDWVSFLFPFTIFPTVFFLVGAVLSLRVTHLRLLRSSLAPPDHAAPAPS